MVNDEITRLHNIKVLKLKMCEGKLKVGVVNEGSTMKPRKNDLLKKVGFTRTKDSPSQSQKSFRRDSCQSLNYLNSNLLSATDTTPANKQEVMLTADA